MSVEILIQPGDPEVLFTGNWTCMRLSNKFHFIHLEGFSSSNWSGVPGVVVDIGCARQKRRSTTPL